MTNHKNEQDFLQQGSWKLTYEANVGKSEGLQLKLPQKQVELLHITHNWGLNSAQDPNPASPDQQNVKQRIKI